MIRLAVLAATLLLAACASPKPVALEGQPAERNVIAVATLATNDCEATTASTYTAAIMSVKVAAERVRRGTLSPDEGQRLADLGRDAKGWLDSACPGGQLDAAALTEAKADVKAMQDILWSTP